MPATDHVQGLPRVIRLRFILYQVVYLLQSVIKTLVCTLKYCRIGFELSTTIGSSVVYPTPAPSLSNIFNQICLTISVIVI